MTLTTAERLLLLDVALCTCEGVTATAPGFPVAALSTLQDYLERYWDQHPELGQDFGKFLEAQKAAVEKAANSPALFGFDEESGDA